MVGAIALSASSAAADTQGPIDFESYTPGNINGQDGWTRAGSYDHVVSDNSTLPFAPGSFGTKSLRISDAVTSGAFDQTYSKKVVRRGRRADCGRGRIPVRNPANQLPSVVRLRVGDTRN